MSSRKLYLFLDEGGNLDFSPKGSHYFSLSCLSIERPFSFQSILDNYKYDLIEYGLNTEFFHCSNDNSHVRKKIFEIIKNRLNNFKIDCLLAEKHKATSELRSERKFYPTMIGHLLAHIIPYYSQNEISELIIITDNIPINRKRKTIEKSIKLILKEVLKNNAKYRIIHHSSKAHYGLQLVDYCNWAVLRKWEHKDEKSYQLIKFAIRSELDISNRMEVEFIK